MATCPECDAEIEVDEFDVDKGDLISCPDCGANLEVTSTSPVELEAADDDEDEEEDDDEEPKKKTTSTRMTTTSTGRRRDRRRTGTSEPRAAGETPRPRAADAGAEQGGGERGPGALEAELDRKDRRCGALSSSSRR